MKNYTIDYLGGFQGLYSTKHSAIKAAKKLSAVTEQIITVHNWKRKAQKWLQIGFAYKGVYIKY